MRKIIKSWRWKCLTEREFWKSFCEENSLLIVVLTIGWILFIATDNQLGVGFEATLVYIVILVQLIATICFADEYFELTDSHNNKCCIYIYREELNGHKVVAKYSDREIYFRADAYIIPNEENGEYFVYNSTDSEMWRIVTPSSYEHENLGTKISPQIYQLDEDHINILQAFDKKYATIKCDEVYFGDQVFIPKNSRENLLQKIDDEWCDIDEPDRYLFIKTNEQYQLYGLYLSSVDDITPQVVKINAPTVIACDLFQKYVFVLDGDTYALKVKKRNYCRKANDIFIEPLHNTGMMSEIMQYDENTQTCKYLIKCLITAMDFDDVDIFGLSSDGEIYIYYDENSEVVIQKENSH